MGVEKSSEGDYVALPARFSAWFLAALDRPIRLFVAPGLTRAESKRRNAASSSVMSHDFEGPTGTLKDEDKVRQCGK